MYEDVVRQRSLASIANGLTEAKVKTATGKDDWCPATVRAIIKNRVYMGEQYANRTWLNGQTVGYEKATLLPAESVCALVSPELWYAAQDALTRNKEMASRNNSHPDAGLLRGMVYCVHCGKKMHHDPAEGRCLRLPLPEPEVPQPLPEHPCLHA
jgi:hypothetical protein